MSNRLGFIFANKLSDFFFIIIDCFKTKAMQFGTYMYNAHGILWPILCIGSTKRRNKFIALVSKFNALLILRLPVFTSLYA